MLQRLYIQNYALIDELELTPGPQLNLITGETGAGKSIVVGALGLILGNRADSTVVLDPERKCVVEAEFVLKDDSPAWALMAENDLDREGNTLILRRELTPQGKSRAFVNDSPTTLPVLKDLTTLLVDLHSQRDGQRLLDEREQLAILDQYAGTGPQVASFGQKLRLIQAQERELADLNNRSELAQREADYRGHQLEELTQAKLLPGEDEQVEQELQALQHYEALTLALGTALDALGNDTDMAAGSRLTQQLRALDKVQHLLPSLPPEVDKLREAQILLNDAAAGLQAVLDSLEADPARLAKLEERHDLYNRLKLKYKVTTATQLINLRDELAMVQLAEGSSAERMASLQKDIAEGYQQLASQGLELEDKRRKAAEELAHAINEQLAAVALPHASFSIQLGRIEKADGPIMVEGQSIAPQASGLNTLTFRVRTNPGTPEGLLSQVASGGELARIMLAMKAALAQRMALPLLIFDEIDTGISGEVALKVGRVMQQLAQHHQLITITHLPQIASRPGTHYYIYKEVMNGSTHTHLRALVAEDRVREVARIMAGDNPGEAALASAAELMK